MYGGYCQLIIQLQPWIEKVFDFAISNFTWPLAEKRIENNKKGSDNQWIKRCYNGCNENQPYFFLHIYTLKLISFLELPSWKFGVFLFFLFGLCLISLLEVCYSPGGRVGASHFLTGKGRQAWTGARVRLEFKKKNQVLTQLKCSGDLEILTRGRAGGSGALTPGKLHWFLFGRFLDLPCSLRTHSLGHRKWK